MNTSNDQATTDETPQNLDLAEAPAETQEKARQLAKATAQESQVSDRDLQIKTDEFIAAAQAWLTGADQGEFDPDQFVDDFLLVIADPQVSEQTRDKYRKLGQQIGQKKPSLMKQLKEALDVSVRLGKGAEGYTWERVMGQLVDERVKQLVSANINARDRVPMFYHALKVGDWFESTALLISLGRSSDFREKWLSDYYQSFGKKKQIVIKNRSGENVGFTTISDSSHRLVWVDAKLRRETKAMGHRPDVWLSQTHEYFYQHGRIQGIYLRDIDNHAYMADTETKFFAGRRASTASETWDYCQWETNEIKAANVILGKKIIQWENGLSQSAHQRLQAESETKPQLRSQVEELDLTSNPTDFFRPEALERAKQALNEVKRSADVQLYDPVMRRPKDQVLVFYYVKWRELAQRLADQQQAINLLEASVQNLLGRSQEQNRAQEISRVKQEALNRTQDQLNQAKKEYLDERQRLKLMYRRQRRGFSGPAKRWRSLLFDPLSQEDSGVINPDTGRTLIESDFAFDMGTRKHLMIRKFQDLEMIARSEHVIGLEQEIFIEHMSPELFDELRWCSQHFIYGSRTSTGQYDSLYDIGHHIAEAMANPGLLKQYGDRFIDMMRSAGWKGAVVDQVVSQDKSGNDKTAPRLTLEVSESESVWLDDQLADPKADLDQNNNAFNVLYRWQVLNDTEIARAIEAARREGQVSQIGLETAKRPRSSESLSPLAQIFLTKTDLQTTILGLREHLAQSSSAKQELANLLAEHNPVASELEKNFKALASDETIYGRELDSFSPAAQDTVRSALAAVLAKAGKAGFAAPSKENILSELKTKEVLALFDNNLDHLADHLASKMQEAFTHYQVALQLLRNVRYLIQPQYERWIKIEEKTPQEEEFKVEVNQFYDQADSLTQKQGPSLGNGLSHEDKVEAARLLGTDDEQSSDLKDDSEIVKQLTGLLVVLAAFKAGSPAPASQPANT